MQNLDISDLKRTPIEKRSVEIVERKGIGHPDTLSDGIAEAVSKKLSNHYRDEYDRILHHNTDQVEIVGGKVNVDFGEGRTVEPIHVMLSGRATTEVSGEEVPVHEMALETARSFLRENLSLDSIEENFVFDSKIGHGSVDLTNLYKDGDVPKANDTSFGVGYAPLSETEELVLEIDREINSDSFSKRYPELGEDVKLMALRKNSEIDLTIAGAFRARKVPDIDHYVSVKEDVVEEVQDIASRKTDRDVNVHMNTADDYDEEIVYLTLTGTSAEAGDDGSVGRGNRSNGLITPCRPMSMEAPAGKNPLAHVGKIYNVFAHNLANEVNENTDVDEVQIKVLSQIGRPIDDPHMVEVQARNGTSNDVRYEIEKIIQDSLNDITDITDEILNGNLYVY
ncbi:MAG: methionine adenosyltransferase [Candidatus Aenigmatarchaeota archaeon]